MTTPKQLIAGMIQSRSGKEAKGANSITLLRKRPDGSAERDRFVYIDHLHSPFGMQLIGNTLYVADMDATLKFAYVPGATSIPTAGMEVTDLPDRINHHWTKALLASHDGMKLYVGVGSNSNASENGLDVEYRRANVLEVDPASGGSRIFAAGVRNPTGLQWEPHTGSYGRLRMNATRSVRTWCRTICPRSGTALFTAGLTATMATTSTGVYSRSAPIWSRRPSNRTMRSARTWHRWGLWFTGTNLPAQYRGGAFIGEHGSWDRSPLNGYAVVYVAFENGKPVGTPTPVVTGFVSDDEKELYGAPVGVAQDQDGALLIADDAGNAVWRVTGSGG